MISEEKKKQNKIFLKEYQGGKEKTDNNNYKN
jgi:hypothetical protein